MTGANRRGLEEILVPTLSRQSLSERVARILKHYIDTEHLVAGDRLPTEQRLADWLNVSRTVLREALNQLLGAGVLVRPSPRVLCVGEFDRGRLPADLAADDFDDRAMRELAELRVIIELGAIEVTVHRASDEHLRDIEHWVVEGERRFAAGEPLDITDARFHAALLRVLGNRTVDAFIPLIEEHLRQTLLSDPQRGKPDDYRVVLEHRQIFEAVARRDVEVARAGMLTHLNSYLQRDERTAFAEANARS